MSKRHLMQILRVIVPAIAGLVLLLSAASHAAEAPIQLRGNQIAVGEVMAVGAADVIGLEGPSQTPLLVIDAPPVGSRGARITGRIESFDVEPEAWIELWAIYPDGSRSVQRTLDRDRPDLRLAGTTERRHFELSVALGPGGAKPQRLELNVAMFGRGIISVANLRLERDGARADERGAAISLLGFGIGDPGAGARRAVPVSFGALVVGAGMAGHARIRRRLSGADRIGIEQLQELA